MMKISQSVCDSIMFAVCDGSQRVWNIEEIDLIASNVNLQSILIHWSENSLSDCCWHPQNYKLLREMSNHWRCGSFDVQQISDSLSTLDFEEYIDIHF
jgi:hypothetical protein